MFLVSKCCAGIHCRYRGNGYFRQFLEKLGREEDFIAMCPEQMAGLPTPREPCYVKNSRVIGRRTRTDYTKAFQNSAYKILHTCEDLGITKAFLLKNSPACGKGYGVVARLLDRHGIEVIPV
jgi:uncharacterized protein YbbK (DUF523 family)